MRHLRGGELLVNTASEWLAHGGATEIYAWVADTNRNARRFYERLGFGPSGDHQPTARAKSEWETLLVRDVTSAAQSPRAPHAPVPPAG